MGAIRNSFRSSKWKNTSSISAMTFHSFQNMIVEFDKCPALYGQQYTDILSHLLNGTLHAAISHTRAGTEYEGLTGIVIEGPSGVGKTALIQRFAWECRNYFKVLSVSCSDLVNKVVGNSERRIDELFAVCRNVAPAILIMENIESLLGRVSEFGRKFTRARDIVMDRVLSSLLVNIDGISPSRNIRSSRTDNFSSPVIVIATTECLAAIDTSLVRPGRLEEHIFIGELTTLDRMSIIVPYLDKIELIDVTETEKRNKFLQTLVEMSYGW